MSDFRIVFAKDKETGRSRYFMERSKEGVLTYHNYERIIRKWGRRYGCYNLIKQEAGQAIFFNVGKICYQVVVIKEIELVDSKTVSCGYTSVDKAFN